MFKKGLLLIALVFLFPNIVLAETIDVMIKGIDDGVKTNRQQDYNEAVMNAKLQAIERAGVEVQSITQVVNFQTKFDMVESKAKAILLPGFQIMDIGYIKDGTYQVVLNGKVKTAEEGIENKHLRYARSLVNRRKWKKAGEIIDKIIDSSVNDAAVAEALYYKAVWGMGDLQEQLEKLRAFYPKSKYISKLKNFYRLKQTTKKVVIDNISKGELIHSDYIKVEDRTRKSNTYKAEFNGSFIGNDFKKHDVKVVVEHTYRDYYDTNSGTYDLRKFKIYIDGKQTRSKRFSFHSYKGGNPGLETIDNTLPNDRLKIDVRPYEYKADFSCKVERLDIPNIYLLEDYGAPPVKPYVVVHSITEGSQAEKVGLMEGDIINKYGDKRIDSGNKLADLASNTSPDKTVTILINRYGKKKELELQGGTLGINVITVEE